MRKRPLSVTIISWVYIATGGIALVYHLLPQQVGQLRRESSSSWAIVWICLVRILAAVAGVFMLRGCNWARWLAVAWMLYHVCLSILHPVSELIAHCVFLAIIAYFLFRRPASVYFRSGAT